MTHAPAVLLLDDGELDDVQEILENLGVEFARVRGGAIAPGAPLPTALLVSTPRRIDALGNPDPSDTATATEEDPPIRVVVVHEDSNSLRAQLREIGFDFIVRRPVHTEALRLLNMHCLYRGEERRSEPRVAVGFEISFRSGVLPRCATLVDLSSRGCRLLSPYALEPGKRIRVQIPESLGASEQLGIDGRIVRMTFDERLGSEGLYSAAVAFENVSIEVRHELEWIIEETTQGPPTLRTMGNESGEWIEEEPGGEAVSVRRESNPIPTSTRRSTRRRSGLRETVSPSCPPDPRSEGAAIASDATRLIDDSPTTLTPLGAPVGVKMTATQGDETAAGEEPGEDTSETTEAHRERRSSSRHPFGAKVPAFGSRALRVLVGRDLSVGGMRIEYHADLEVGDRLHLAIYGCAGEEPFLVWGTVQRDDGDVGMGVVFDRVHPMIGEHLEKLVASLPAVESLHDSEAAAMGTVLTEILEE